MKGIHLHRTQEQALRQISWGRLGWGAGFFLVLTALTLWWVVRQNPDPWQAPDVGQLQWRFLLAMMLLIPIEPLAGGGRVWLISRVEGTPIPFLTCLRSELANIGVAMLAHIFSRR